MNAYANGSAVSLSPPAAATAIRSRRKSSSLSSSPSHFGYCLIEFPPSTRLHFIPQPLSHHFVQICIGIASERIPGPALARANAARSSGRYDNGREAISRIICAEQWRTMKHFIQSSLVCAQYERRANEMSSLSAVITKALLSILSRRVCFRFSAFFIITFLLFSRRAASRQWNKK